MRTLRFELAAMVLVVALAGFSVLATFGSARSGDLVFCQLADGDVVVGVTTDCADARPSLDTMIADLSVVIDFGEDGPSRPLTWGT